MKLLQNKTFCEFFAGIGLVGEALKNSSWDCVYANDIDPKKKAMFEGHFGESAHYHLGDVWETDHVISRISGNPFLATASFPCTDLSTAGYWKGIEGRESSTYFGFLKAIEAMGDNRPSLIMLENVLGFLTAGKGKDFPRAIRALADLGYWIDAFEVDAKLFVPQSRPRLFVIGVHDRVRSPLLIKQSGSPGDSSDWQDAIAESGELRPASLVKIMKTTKLPTGWFTVPLQLPDPVAYNLSEVINLDDEQDWWDEERTKQHYEMFHDYHRVKIDEFLNSGETFVGTAFRRTRSDGVRAEIRFDGIAGCLRTPKGGSARQIVCVVQDKKMRMRWMSPIEYARLKGAGHYKLNGTDNELMFGFGDAVCVPVIEWIDQNMLTPIYNATKAQLFDVDRVNPNGQVNRSMLRSKRGMIHGY